LRHKFTNRNPCIPAKYWLTMFSRLPLRRALTTRPSSFLASAMMSACCSAESCAACAACSCTLTTPAFVVISDTVLPSKSGAMAHGVLSNTVGRLFRRQPIAGGAKCQSYPRDSAPPKCAEHRCAATRKILRNFRRARSCDDPGWTDCQRPGVASLRHRPDSRAESARIAPHAALESAPGAPQGQSTTRALPGVEPGLPPIGQCAQLSPFPGQNLLHGPSGAPGPKFV
jgi:hypothetical protein